MLSPFCTHRHPDFWTDPDRFDPDRWTRDAETTRHGHSYHPFAAGPRTCIGNNFSLLESHLLLAILARRFRPRLGDGFVPHFVMRGTLSIEGGHAGRDRDAVLRKVACVGAHTPRSSRPGPRVRSQLRCCCGA
jgi:cytochrome P450